MSELKPCPFCGGKVVPVVGRASSSGTHEKMQGQTGLRPAKIKAILRTLRRLECSPLLAADEVGGGGLGVPDDPPQTFPPRAAR